MKEEGAGREDIIEGGEAGREDIIEEGGGREGGRIL